MSPKAVVRAFVIGALAAFLVDVVAAVDAAADQAKRSDPNPFVLDDGRDLRQMADPATRALLQPVRGQGNVFDAKKATRYCRLKRNTAATQWAIADLDSGRVMAQSANANVLFFGASTSKLFVAAAFLDARRGRITREELALLVKMIVVSDNPAWLELQRRVGGTGSDEAGRDAVHAFVRRMGYPSIKGFQGWRRDERGRRDHGNELNAIEVSQLLIDTYTRKYLGADVLWSIMQATRTGKNKVDKYVPSDVRVGGKTGTYSGPNASPQTVHLPTIAARNHAAVLLTDHGHYGLTVLTNTGSSEDAAVLAGGLMREYLGLGGTASCR